MARKPCCDDHMSKRLKRGPWTPEEDRKLTNYIMRNGHYNWRALPKEAGLLRCGKSCRLRWTNYLRPGVKRGNFTEQEEDTIIKLQESLGNKWSKIASYLPGRTDNEIKNIWNTYLKKRSLELKRSSIASGDEQNGFSVSSSSVSTDSPMSYCNPGSRQDWNNHKVHDMVCCMNNSEKPLADQIAPADSLFQNWDSLCLSKIINKNRNVNRVYKEHYTSPSSYSTAGGSNESNPSKEVYGSRAHEEQEEENKGKDPSEAILRNIPFEPDLSILDNMLESTDHDESSFFTSNSIMAPPLCDYGAHSNKDLKKEPGQSVKYEVGLQETNTSTQANNQKTILNDAVEPQMVTDNYEIDPATLYFQMWPPSPHNFTL